MGSGSGGLLSRWCGLGLRNGLLSRWCGFGRRDRPRGRRARFGDRVRIRCGSAGHRLRPGGADGLRPGGVGGQRCRIGRRSGPARRRAELDDPFRPGGCRSIRPRRSGVGPNRVRSGARRAVRRRRGAHRTGATHAGPDRVRELGCRGLQRRARLGCRAGAVPRSYCRMLDVGWPRFAGPRSRPGGCCALLALRWCARRRLGPLLLLRHRGPPRSGPPRTASAPPVGGAVHSRPVPIVRICRHLGGSCGD